MKTVHIKTPDSPSRGVGTTITTSDGQQLRGVARISFDCTPKETIRASLELFSSVDIQALGQLCMKHPLSGELKQVARIEFADGSVYSA